MIQSINVKHVLLVVYAYVSLHLYVMFVPDFNRLNFFILEWTSPISLRCVDLDLTFQVEKHVAITDASSNEEKTHYRV